MPFTSPCSQATTKAYFRPSPSPGSASRTPLLPSPPRSLARQPPHRAGGTAAAGASSPPGRPRRTPPPPCWKRARRRRDRTGSRECAARPLPPSLRRGSLLLSREARGAEPAAAENGGANPGPQVSAVLVVQEPDFPQRPPPGLPLPHILSFLIHSSVSQRKHGHGHLPENHRGLSP